MKIEWKGSTNKSSSGGSDGSEGSCLCDRAGGCTCGCRCRQAPTEGRNAAGCHCWSGHFDAPLWVGRWRDCAPNPPRTIATWDDGGCECLRMGGGMLGRGGGSEWWATARQPVSSDSWLWPQLLATPPLRLINNLDYPSLPCPWIIFLLSSPSACLKSTPHQLYNRKKRKRRWWQPSPHRSTWWWCWGCHLVIPKTIDYHHQHVEWIVWECPQH